MRKILKIWLPLLVVAFSLSACSNNFSMDKTAEAKALIDTIIASGAADFAPGKLADIQKLYDETMKEISHQETLTFKNYTTAEYNLNQVMDECDLLRANMAKAKGEPPVVVVARNKFVGF